VARAVLSGEVRGIAAGAEKGESTMSSSLMTQKTTTFGYGARAKWATVRIETDGATYVGRLFVPESKKRLSDVLCDERPFLNMTEVTINESEQVEPFIALNKTFVKTVRVLHEGEAEAAARKS
jgi:hypothetical protein